MDPNTVPPALNTPPKKSAKLVWIGLAIIILLGASAGALYMLFNQKAPEAKPQSTDTRQTSTQSKTDKTIELDKTYVDTTGKFSVKYPSTWKVKTETGIQGDPNSPTTTSTLTSPAGTVLNLRSDWGGRGGMCEPEATDKPFAAGNVCPTIQTLTAETLPVDNVYYADTEVGASSSKSTYKQAAVVLVTEHWADTKGVSQYVVGVASTNLNDGQLAFAPTMGALSSYPWITNYNAAGKFQPYIYAYASGKTADFLKSDDVSVIKDILRTLTVN